MKVIKKPDGYWVTDIPDCEPCGPYTTKADADDTMRGLDRFFKFHDEPGFITCETRKCRDRNTSTSSDTVSQDAQGTGKSLRASPLRKKRSSGRASAHSADAESN